MIDQKWLENCATAGEFLYGFYPVSVLKMMYETKRNCKAADAELIDAVVQSDAVLMDYMEGRLVDFGNYGEGFFAPLELEGTQLEPMMKKAVESGNPYAELHLDDDTRMDLMVRQGDTDFYIPTEKEITELIEDGYIHSTAMTALKEEIEKQGGNSKLLAGIWQQYSTDALDQYEAINGIINELFPGAIGSRSAKPAGKAVKVPMIDDLNAMMPMISEFLNNVNLRANRGWRPKDLFKKMYPNGLKSMPTLMPASVRAAKNMREAETQFRAMGVNVDYSSIDNFATVGPHGERRIVKVGRNDPCPCGSGKKYKQCHGRFST